MSVCSVEFDLGPWETVTQRCCSKRNVFPTPPGLKVNKLGTLGGSKASYLKRRSQALEREDD